MLGTATHGGLSFRFPDKSGSVEIGTDPGSGKNAAQIFAYFQGPDGSPMTTAPTDVKIARGTLSAIPLTPQGEAGRFASAPGPRIDDLRGVLEATIGGNKVEVPFSIH